MQIRKISAKEALRMIVKYHYSKVMPKLNKVYLGGFVEGRLVAIMTLGWGVRPKHTIKKLFPSLDTKDYYEIGKLCVADEMPRNTESVFISKCIDYVKEKNKNLKLIFTWADGMLGKCGYVYQASNFLYGGYIWTDSYFTSNGEKVHPRSTGRIGGRPNEEKRKEHDLKQYFGKQFRYVFFTCSKGERKRLLSESPFIWGKDYPKEMDLEWKTKVGNTISSCEKPKYCKDISHFNIGAKKNIDWVRKNRPLSEFTAEEVSRERRQFSKLEGLRQFQYSAFLSER